MTSLSNRIKEFDSILLEPYSYLKKHPGKEIRSSLIKAFNHWLSVPSERLEIIKSVTEILHNASLLVDDVEDGSTLRRGLPVAHKIYGTAHTINCANFEYFLALQKLMEMHKVVGSDKSKHIIVSAVNIFTEELINLHRGQGMDIYWRDTCSCPTEELYLEMIDSKTGGLLRLAVKLMLLFSENSNANDDDDTTVRMDSLIQSPYVPLVNIIGQYYQIRDDYINLQSKEYMESKSYCEDLTEGKFSFPIIHSICSSESENRTLINILKQKPTEIELKRHAVKIMEEETKSFEYTVNRLQQVEQKARDMIRDLGGNSKLEEIFDVLSEVYKNK